MSGTEDDIQLLIADDHPIFRKGLRQVIETEAGLKVVAEADEGLAALERIKQLQPHIAILDIHMPKMSGFELARTIYEQGINVAIIFLTMHKAEDMFNAAIEIGVKGYVLKESAVTDIVASIRAVADGQHYISPQLSSFLFNRSARQPSPLQPLPGLAELTPTERRVLKMIAEYHTSKQIADQLFITSRTVDNHRANICQKLGLRGTHSLMKFAVEHKSEI